MIEHAIGSLEAEEWCFWEKSLERYEDSSQSRREEEKLDVIETDDFDPRNTGYITYSEKIIFLQILFMNKVYWIFFSLIYFT